MPTLNISEFKSPNAVGASFGNDALPFPLVATQAMGLTGPGGSTSAQFNAKTNAVLLMSDTDCHFNIGATGATGGAWTPGTYLPAKVPLLIAVPPSYYLNAVTP
jgi:hypothetical protein